LNIESSRQTWIGTAGTSAEQNSLHSRQTIRGVRIRMAMAMAMAIAIASLALLAVASGIVLVAIDGLDVIEIFAWGLIAAVLATLIALIIRAHGRPQARLLPVLDHVEASLARATRLESLIRNQQWLFWAPMLIAFVLLAIASDYRHWTDYTFAVTSMGVVIWGLVYGRDCVLARIEADRHVLQEQAILLRGIETEGGEQ